MKKRIILSILGTVGALQTAWAERVAGDEQYFVQMKHRWSQLVTPDPFFAPILVLLVVLSIVGIALCARLKGVRILSPSFLFPSFLLALVLWPFTHVPPALAEMFADFGAPLPQTTSWAWIPFCFGSRWYGPLIICAAWVLTHPILLRAPSSHFQRTEGLVVSSPHCSHVSDVRLVLHRPNVILFQYGLMVEPHI